MRSRRAIWGAGASLVSLLAGACEAVTIGERPAIERHAEEADIEAGRIPLVEVLRHGQAVFEAQWNRLDGQGRPLTTGAGAPRTAGQPAFIRTSGPDANSCAGCHAQPRTGGSGEFFANVFVLAQEFDPVVMSLDAKTSNERGTVGMFGAGPIELLAREMSAELIGIREAARTEAAQRETAVTRDLWAKGVSFGRIRVLPDGRIDPHEIRGVDWDLVVRPFHQKGASVSLRDFSNTALNQHFGMQSAERFGATVDADGDGVTNELSVGDVTALTLFQAALGVPGRVVPADPARRAAVKRGERRFEDVGCTSCHLRALELDDPTFTEPGPYNPPGTLRVSEVRTTVAIDLTREGLFPRLERLPNGHALVRAYTDLKRHDLNDAELNHFADEQVAQGTLAARVPAATFTEYPRARPLREFLTRKLWDVGNSAPYGHRGDLTMLTDAIHFHGGEARSSRDAYFALSRDDQAAVIEFLKSLQVLPAGPTGLVQRERSPAPPL